jgi:hypothetical protein
VSMSLPMVLVGVRSNALSTKTEMLVLAQMVQDLFAMPVA